MGRRKALEPVTLNALQSFLRRLGERYADAGALYLLGGSALCLLGNPRTTVDVDYTFELAEGSVEEFERVVDELAAEMNIYVDRVPLAEFVPLPPQAHERRLPVGRFGRLDVFVYDLYSIALSKIARGFESDLEDVHFLLHAGLIEFGELERLFRAVLPDVSKTDVIPSEFCDYFDQVRRRWEQLAK
jgi:hypothetical protein